MSEKNKMNENLVHVVVDMARNVTEHGVVGTVEIPEEWLKLIDSDPGIRQKIVEKIQAELDYGNYNMNDMSTIPKATNGLRLRFLRHGLDQHSMIEPLEHNNSALGEIFMSVMDKNAIECKEDVDYLVRKIAKWSCKDESEVRGMVEWFAHSVESIAKQELLKKNSGTVYRVEEDRHGGLNVIRSRDGMDNASLYLQPGNDLGVLNLQLDAIDCLPEHLRDGIRQGVLRQYDAVMFDTVMSADEDQVMDANSKQNNGSGYGSDNLGQC